MGENLDLSGGTIKVIYSDDTTAIIPMTSEDIHVTGYDKNKEDIQIIYIEYLGNIDDFSVTVTRKTEDGEETEDKNRTND